jgi:hypothetical protein
MALAVGLAVAAGCSSDLPPPSVVDGVRILAASANLPYAKPGAHVTIQVLAADGRAQRPEPMRVFWLPTVCMNPAGDDYYGCYPAMAGQYPRGRDLTSVLVAGNSFDFTMPADTITTAVPHPGATDPYGLAFAFVMACAGHVEYVPVDTSVQSPLTTPFGCFDSSGRALGPQDFVFAFVRVYAFTDRLDANPVIQHVTFGGAAVDPAVGISVPHCTASDEAHCATTDVDTVVPDSSWQLDPGSLSASGGDLHEGIWVDYYVTAGKFEEDSELLFDAQSGRVSSTGDGYAAPLSPGLQTLWVVVHDTRGGASWVTLPIHVN